MTTTIEARHLDGLSTKMNAVESVGEIMVRFAKTQQQFASDVVVVCVDSGKNLSDAPSQTPPPVVQVVVKPETKRTREDLLLTLRLHSMCEDAATCELAYNLLREHYVEQDNIEELLFTLLVHVLTAAACGDPKLEKHILRTLIRAGVNANFFLQDAAGTGNECRVKMLLAEGVPVDCGYGSGDKIACNIPALSTAAWVGAVDTVEILLAHKADVNRYAHVHEAPSISVCLEPEKPDKHGTPLVLASQEGNADVVEMLIKHEADVNLSSIVNWPLNAACSEEHIDVVKILLSHGADVNYTIPLQMHNAPIMWAAVLGNVDLAKLLISHKANIQFFDETHETPIIKAVCCHSCYFTNSTMNFGGKIEVLKLLISHKASVNIGNKRDGTTALVTAMTNEEVQDAIKVLLDHNADANRGTCDGNYPLLIAARSGDADMVNLLLAHKANPHVNSILKTAIADASKENHKAVLEILEPLNAFAEASKVIPKAVLEISEPSYTISDIFDDWKTRSLTGKNSSFDQALTTKEQQELVAWTIKEGDAFLKLGRQLKCWTFKLFISQSGYIKEPNDQTKCGRDFAERNLVDVTSAREDFLRTRCCPNTEEGRKSENPSCSQCLTDDERLDLMSWTMKEAVELENMGIKLDRRGNLLNFAQKLYDASENDERKTRREEAERYLLDAVAERKEFLSKRILLNASKGAENVSTVSAVVDESKPESRRCSETSVSKRVKTNDETIGKESDVPEQDVA